MHPLQRQRPFLQCVLREKNDHLRQERLQHANADQINALSLLALTTPKSSYNLLPLCYTRWVNGVNL